MRHCLALLFLVAANCFGQSDISTLLSKANHGDSQAQLLIAKAYEKGDGVPQSDELAVQWYTKAAQNGNPDAQNALGVIYSTGHGVERDKEAAVRWYRMAAKQGSAVAAFNLGAAYYNGDGVPVDDAASLEWFLIAKESGSGPAAAAVERAVAEDVRKSIVTRGELQAAALCEQGTEVPQNYELAMKFYREAFERGDNVAAVRLGNLFAEGKGVSRDDEQAVTWYRRAADNKYPIGYFYLGLMADHGRGMAADPIRAVDWYSKAADAQEPHAMINLGLIYQDGRPGVPQDNVRAYEYFLLASLYGVPNGTKAAEQLKARMPQKQISEAKKRADKWLLSHRAGGLLTSAPQPTEGPK